MDDNKNKDELLRALLLSDAGQETTSQELLSLILSDEVNVTGSSYSAAAVATHNDDASLADDADLLLLDDLTDLSFLDADLAVDSSDAATRDNASGASASALCDANIMAQEETNEHSSSNAQEHHYSSVHTAGPPRAITPATTAFVGGSEPLATVVSRLVRPPVIEKTATPAHRRRIKDELEYLRQQVHVLEQRLEGFRTQPATVKTSSGELSTPSISPQPLPLTDSNEATLSELIEITPSANSHLWKRIAEHQLDEKHKAEAENQKLKAVLESQLKIAKSISKLLRKRPDVSWLDSQQLGSQKRLRLDTLTGERDVFEELSERVATLYDQLDQVFLNAGLMDVDTELQDGAAKSNAFGTMFLEVIDCKLMPFEVRTTAAAMWKTLSQSSMTVTNGVYQAVDVREDTLRAQYSVTLQLRRVDVPIHMRVAYRRITEPSRVVLVWSCEGASESLVSTGKDRLKFFQSGWSVIEQVTPREATNGSEQAATTIIKSVLRMTPEMENIDTSEKSYHVGMFTDIVISSFHQNITILYQNVENFIMSELAKTILPCK